MIRYDNFSFRTAREILMYECGRLSQFENFVSSVTELHIFYLPDDAFKTQIGHELVIELSQPQEYFFWLRS